MSAPDFAAVSDSTPAMPAQNATKNAKKSGLAMILDRLWEAASKFSGLAPIAWNSRRRDRHDRDRDREADRQREQRAQRQRRSALDERDADPGDRAELRADDHRADDEDRRVEQDADGRDEPGEHHERGERPVQLGGLRRPRRHLLPHDGVGRRALRLADRPLHAVGDAGSRPPGRRSSRRAPPRGRAGRSRTTDASSRARSTRMRSPSGRRAAPGRWTRLHAEGSSSSSPRTSSASAPGTTMRRWYMGP